MDIKHLQFSFRMYWANMKGLLNMVAEGIILVASLASLFILVYQFGFKYSAHVTHMLETSRVYLLLAFFTGISLRYILQYKEIIQEKMLYLDIGIYFFLFAVLSGKVFFKEAIHQSLPYLGFLTEPLFVYFLLLLLSAIHLSRQTFTLLQSHIKPSLLFLSVSAALSVRYAHPPAYAGNDFSHLVPDTRTGKPPFSSPYFPLYKGIFPQAPFSPKQD